MYWDYFPREILLKSLALAEDLKVMNRTGDFV